MNHSPALQTSGRRIGARLGSISTRLFLAMLERLNHGHLELITPHGTTLTFGDLRQPPSAQLRILDWRACGAILRAGDIGFGEAYGNGWVDTPDLAALLRLAMRNRKALSGAVEGGRLASWWYRLRHLLRSNTRTGSRRNIHAHYDLGNDFYQLWLDPSMTYSSAIFSQPGQSLASAQAAKYQRIIDQLGLRSGDRVLEIGCGWGGFAEHAARLGIRVHGVTISPAQLAFAQDRLRHQQLDHLAHLELCDYRDLDGQYDAIVSIEMFEAVGERFWQTYFETVAARLKAGGRALIQSITIDEAVFERYRDSADFIREFIFPGGMLPSHERFSRGAQRAGLATRDRFHFGRDYAETLRRWNDTFQARRETIAAQGFDERFRRLWQLYYVFCEVGFDEGQTDVVQFLLQKE
ncbi:SAM-dependent methyltransferase [Herbaspirillum frisingense]|uniref:SAM-dependent methyltransferase n=1 Tax=Herbaspirillum frisingense TaxID=92645 RepID=UPI001F1DA635|nr:cyclopropane-fatty-acyl-phospholipid synthase family protein [Herbaspirillum frisingense]UIN22394.1 cyclopropane-fatty-acyl-phospholipid synthase family protein [Herbaspirillum frisingense]